MSRNDDDEEMQEKSVKKVESVDISKKIDELLNKAKCAVPGAEKRPKGLKVQCPVWMEEYAARHPNVDFSRCPLGFWRGANNFLFKSFHRAYEERDGDRTKGVYSKYLRQLKGRYVDVLITAYSEAKNGE